MEMYGGVYIVDGFDDCGGASGVSEAVRRDEPCNIFNHFCPGFPGPVGLGFYCRGPRGRKKGSGNRAP